VSHFLFIRNEPSIPISLREIFSAPEKQIIIRQSAIEAQSALTRGAFDAAIVYSENETYTLKRTVTEIRSLSTQICIIVLTTEYSKQLEDTAFSAGADLYLAEPIPARTMARILQNQCNSAQIPTPQQLYPPQQATIEHTQAHSHAASTLNVLRDLSHILSFSLDYSAFTQHFILKLRDHISFSRVGIFLEASAKQSLVKNKQSQSLTCIASLGLPTDLVDCFKLNRKVGLGHELTQHPRILSRDDATRTVSTETANAISKEFAVLGCHLAIPITDRENVIGLAVLNGPVTGRNYTEDELELLYLLMEELGLAIRNSRLHNELAQHGELIENVMHSMSSGAIVFSEDLEILYINEAAMRFLGLRQSGPDRNIDFAELPANLTTPVHRAVEKGERLAPFKISGNKINEIYQISIFPFRQKGEQVQLPRPTMVILEDFTKIEASKEAALEHSKTEIISLIAERFAHEIRNSLVPLTTHAQLIDKKINQPQFQASLKSAMLKETARIKRFSEQMLYLAQFSQTGHSKLDPEAIITNAFDRAKCIHPSTTEATLKLKNQAPDATIKANTEALCYVFEELLLNSLQTEQSEQCIQVQIQQENETMLSIRLRDSGTGIDSKILDKAIEPFYTTRPTGIGLGLSVAHKVITEHNGTLKLNNRCPDRDWDVEIKLPTSELSSHKS
jgi:nitrogen-specific signal transduction histidine kinase/DNA-binding NarL/FixJ family response regulator